MHLGKVPKVQYADVEKKTITTWLEFSKYSDGPSGLKCTGTNNFQNGNRDRVGLAAYSARGKFVFLWRIAVSSDLDFA